MSLVGIVMLPFYVATLGVGAYGLVALLIALQNMLALLDFGLSGTLLREAARHRAGVVAGTQLRQFLRLIEALFLVIAAAISILFLLGAHFIASEWLRNDAVPQSQAVQSLGLIGLILSLRFIVIPYRALLTGLEDLQWLALANCLFATARSVLVMIPLATLEPSLRLFFIWQLGVGLAEAITFALRGYRRGAFGPGRLLPRLSTMDPHWRFSLLLAASAALWVAATNVDKVLLSGWLPLSQFSMFSIAATAAGGVLLAIGPIAMALGPRLAGLHAVEDVEGTDRLYRHMTQLTVVVAASAALTLALFPAETIWAWTGDRQLAEDASPVLALYAVGNGLLAIGGLPFQLQMAAGHLKLHVAGMSLFLLAQLPLLWFATREVGMAGAGAAWLAANFLFLLAWVPIAHRRFLPSSHFRWLTRDVLALLILPTAVAFALRWLLPFPQSRAVAATEIGAIGMVLLLASFGGARRLHIGLAARG